MGEWLALCSCYVLVNRRNRSCSIDSRTVEREAATAPALWALGLLCGLGAAAASEAFLLPFSLVLALAGGLPLAWLGLRWLLRSRRPVVVWEGLSWRMP
jgi:hypothetical protein